MSFLSPLQWLVILAVVLLLFGGRGKVSAIMGDFGKGLRNFKTGLKGNEEDADAAPAEEEVEVIEAAPVNEAAPKKKATPKKAAKKGTAKKKAAAKKTPKKAAKK